MGYLHIDNVNKFQKILEYSELYALEKIHGTSAHIGWNKTNNMPLSFFSGGANNLEFISLFDIDDLRNNFKNCPYQKIVVYGEAYGGKLQNMRATYGKNLKFVVFDVKINNEKWLTVPEAEAFAKRLGLEFVAYEKISNKIEELNTHRDMPSRQAILNGCGNDKIAEGIVLRPLVEEEFHGHRVMAKYKRVEFSERKSGKDTSLDVVKLEMKQKALDIAQEWVTPIRLEHVLDKIKSRLGREADISDMRTIIDAMAEDVIREAQNEIVASPNVVGAIKGETAKLFKKKIFELKEVA